MAQLLSCGSRNAIWNICSGLKNLYRLVESQGHTWRLNDKMVTYTFMHGFQNNLAQLLYLRSKSTIWNIYSGRWRSRSQLKLVQAITSTFMHGFQNNLAQLLALGSRSAIWKTEGQGHTWGSNNKMLISWAPYSYKIFSYKSNRKHIRPCLKKVFNLYELKIIQISGLSLELSGR